MNALIVPRLGTPRPLVMTTYDVVVSGLAGNGTVTATVVAWAAGDVTGNPEPSLDQPGRDGLVLGESVAELAGRALGLTGWRGNDSGGGVDGTPFPRQQKKAS